MYGRLSDGDLIYAPKCIEIGGWKIWNGTAEQYASLGYKPVRYASPEEAPEGAPQFQIDYIDYYKKRGYHPRSLGSNGGFAIQTLGSLINMKLLSFAPEIRSAVLMIHGEKAHSRYFSEDAFKLLQGENKELVIVPGARHTDLYDGIEYIPFDKLTDFFNLYLS